MYFSLKLKTQIEALKISIKIASSKAEKQRKEVAETLAERLGREQRKRLNNACLD